MAKSKKNAQTWLKHFRNLFGGLTLKEELILYPCLGFIILIIFIASALFIKALYSGPVMTPQSNFDDLVWYTAHNLALLEIYLFTIWFFLAGMAVYAFIALKGQIQSQLDEYAKKHIEPKLRKEMEDKFEQERAERALSSDENAPTEQPIEMTSGAD